MIMYAYKIKKFVSYNRVDGYKEYFGLTNLFYFVNGDFLTYWDMNIYHIT